MALPKVRSAKITQKTTGTSFITPAVPVGAVAGDLLLCQIACNTKTTVFPSITAPAGWALIGTEGRSEQASNQRTTFLYWKELKETGESLGEFKASAESGNSINALVVAIEKGTWSKSSPIEANSSWVAGPEATTQKAPKLTATIGESLAMFFTCTTTAKEPEAGWKEVGATINVVDGFYKETGVGSGESTGEPSYKKTGSITGLTMMILIAPAGSFHTQETTQSQSSSLQRLVERVRPLLTQAQSSALIRTPERILAATAKQVVSLQLGQTKQGEVTQTQVVSVAHSVIRNLQPVTQEQTSFVVRRPERTLLATAKQALTALASKTLFLPTVTQEQNSAAGFRNERIMRATNSQVASRGTGGVVRILRVAQAQAASTHRSLVRAILMTTQTQVAQAGLTKFVFGQVTVKQVVSVGLKNFRKIGRIYAKVFGTEPKAYGDVEE